MLQKKRFGDDRTGPARSYGPDRRDDQMSDQYQPSSMPRTMTGAGGIRKTADQPLDCVRLSIRHGQRNTDNCGAHLASLLYALYNSGRWHDHWEIPGDRVRRSQSLPARVSSCCCLHAGARHSNSGVPGCSNARYKAAAMRCRCNPSRSTLPQCAALIAWPMK
jgi:hypothetical protein